MQNFKGSTKLNFKKVIREYFQKSPENMQIIMR